MSHLLNSLGPFTRPLPEQLVFPPTSVADELVSKATGTPSHLSGSRFAYPGRNPACISPDNAIHYTFHPCATHTCHSIAHVGSCTRTDNDVLHVHPPHLSHSTPAILREHVRQGDGSTCREQSVRRPPIPVMPFCRLRLCVNNESQDREGQGPTFAPIFCETGRSAATVSWDGVSTDSFILPCACPFSVPFRLPTNVIGIVASI